MNHKEVIKRAKSILHTYNEYYLPNRDLKKLMFRAIKYILKYG